MKLKKLMTSMACVALGASLVACDDGESSDPATASRSDLNPPGSLETITGDSQLTLWWTAGNVEEEFKGYYVFATKEATPGAVSYPDGTTTQTVKSVGIPRCADNTAFFEAFGLPATDRACEGATEPEEGTADADSEAFGLQDDGETTEEENTVDVEEPLTNWIPCLDDSGNKVNESLSMPGTAPVVTPQSCTINQYYDATAGELKSMENGETYMFFVVAVMGDDLSQISWTTPLVSDTPSLDVFPQDTVELEQGKYIGLVFDTTKSPWEASFSPPLDCASGVCGLSSATTLSATTPTIFFGRASGGDYPQRIFISGTAGGAVKIQPRGPQTAYGDTTSATRIPGDVAASTYPQAGTGYIVYEDQIFDFEVTDGGNVYYGKVHIDTVSFAGDANTGKATLKVAAVLQPQAGQTHYITFR